MKHLPMLFCLIFVALLGFRYYKPNPPEPLLKPEKLVLLQKPAPRVDSSYDTAYAQHLRRADYKSVLKRNDWTKRVESNIEAQDRLILFYHKEITKRRRLLNRQLDEIAKLEK